VDHSATVPEEQAIRPGARLIERQPAAVVGLAVFILIVMAVILAPVLTPYDPYEQELSDRLQLPSAKHLMGTDSLGRDVFARILYGGRFSLVITAIAVLIAATFGTLIGAVAGRRGGLVDELIMRVIDLIISFPSLVVALVIAAMLRPGFWTLVLALVFSAWTPYARLARAVGLEINTRAFIEAAVALGASEWLIFRKHVIPNTLGPILSTAFLRFGHILLIISGLSYLGLGAQPPLSDWGAMLAEAQTYMRRVPTLILAPGMTIFITAFSVTLAGQGLASMFSQSERVSAERMVASRWFRPRTKASAVHGRRRHSRA
jgi:peptide/nickel transport system permease protein